MLTAKGWKVRRIKEDGGCYEVYALNDKGERVEAYFHPVTLDSVPIKKPMTEAALRPAATVRVWSAAARCGHFVLAGTVLGALLLYEGGPWHERLGLRCFANGRLARVVWLCRKRSLRLFLPTLFSPGPATWSYARALRARQEPHHLGHNPLGGWMIVALLVSALLAAGSGALYATDEFWGDALVYGVHQAAGWALAVFGAAACGGRGFLPACGSAKNLLRAMVTGVKNAATRANARDSGAQGAGGPPRALNKATRLFSWASRKLHHRLLNSQQIALGVQPLQLAGSALPGLQFCQARGFRAQRRVGLAERPIDLARWQHQPRRQPCL